MGAVRAAAGALAVAVTAAAVAGDRMVVRPFGAEGRPLLIDARLYERPDHAVAERRIIGAVQDLARAAGLAAAPRVELDCMDERCRLLEGDWRLGGRVGVSVGGRDGQSRAVVLRVPVLHAAPRWAAACLASQLGGPTRAAVYELRVAPAGVVLAVGTGNGENGARPVLQWHQESPRWRRLGELPAHPAAGAAPDEVDRILERAVVGRLLERPRQFCVVRVRGGGAGVARANLLEFKGGGVDGLRRLETYVHSGTGNAAASRGPDLFMDMGGDGCAEVELVERARAVVWQPQLSERWVWLAASGKRHWAFLVADEGFGEGQAAVEKAWAIGPDGDGASLVGMVPCQVPRDVAPALLGGHPYFGGDVAIACSSIDGGIVLTAAGEADGEVRKLAGGVGFRVKFGGRARLDDRAALALAEAAFAKSGEAFPVLSIGEVGDRRFVGHAGEAGTRIWREAAGRVRELGVFAGVDLAERGHLAVLAAWDGEGTGDPVQGRVCDYEGYVGLSVEGRPGVIVGWSAGSVGRIELLDGARLGEGAVDASVTKLLERGVARSLLAAEGDVAVAWAIEEDRLSAALVNEGREPRWLAQWPEDVGLSHAKTIAESVLDLARGGQAPSHVFRHVDRLVMCRKVTRAATGFGTEISLLDLADAARGLAGPVGWDGVECRQGTPEPADLDRLYWFLREGDGPEHPLAFTTGTTVGVLEDPEEAADRTLYAMRDVGEVQSCAGSFAGENAVRARLTNWLGENACDWMEASGGRTLAYSESEVRLFGAEEEWEVAGVAEGDRLGRDDAQRVLEWVGTARSDANARCSTIRFARIGALRFVAARCIGARFWHRDAKGSATFARDENRDDRELSVVELGWLAQRFGEREREGDGRYALRIDKVVSVQRRGAGDGRRLVLWETGQTGDKVVRCAVVMPEANATHADIAVIGNVVRSQGGARAQGRGLVARETRRSRGSREVAVMSMSATDSCLSAFRGRRVDAELDRLAFEHIGGRRTTPAGESPGWSWRKVELGADPASVVKYLRAGSAPAFESVYQQVPEGAKAKVAVRANEVLFAIRVGEQIHHRLGPVAKECRTVSLQKLSSVMEDFAMNGGEDALDPQQAVFAAVSVNALPDQWLDKHGLRDDFRRALHNASRPCG